MKIYPRVKKVLFSNDMEEEKKQPIMQTEVVENETPETEEVEVAEETETPKAPVDRSVFNCVPCGGEGLKDQYNICPNCQGTGKV